MRNYTANVGVLFRTFVFFAALTLFLLIFQAPAISQNQQLDDSKISLAIDRALIFNKSIDANMIDVECQDGVVTLTGIVNNILAKERALSIAEATKGVRSVVNNITVKPVIMEDSDIKENVEQALFNDPATDSWEISVIVDDGVVTLTGTVESWAEKKLAEDVAKTVKGIVQIQNNLSVEYQAERNDFEIRQDIVNQLEASVWIDEALIEVYVKDGVVKLTGTVGSAAEKRRATGRAWVSGVESVDNSDLKVEWWARDKMRRSDKYQTRTDKEIKKAVEDALLHDPRVFAFAPEVTVSNGVVSLTGNVESLRAKKAAKQDALNTIGVVYVKNYLKVRPQKLYSDQQITEKVEQAIHVDPMLDRLELTITTVNGKVHLNGRVNSKYEKSHAEDIASRQLGVIEVENNLKADEEWEPKSDKAIKEDVENELFWSPFINSDSIEVEVDDGDVVLKGTVNTRYQAQVAVENAYEGGAKSVLNSLNIKYNYGFPENQESTNWFYREDWYPY